MAKEKKRFVCQECGHVSHKWMGKCPECKTWNTFVEESANDVKARVPNYFDRSDSSKHAPRPEALPDVVMDQESRLKTGNAEFDRVMGGGITVGSVSLLAGDPGIGKSTLMTELGSFLPDSRVLYVTGEESNRQVKLRAQRLGVDSEQLYLLAETNVEAIARAVRKLAPDLLVVDSIQTLFRPDLESAPGSVSQVRESTASLIRLTKQSDFATFIVGHVTKKGTIAGPRVLEHMVDTVLQFEGDRHHAYRILRSIKNRFGAANEIGVFEMRETGLHEVSNPSQMFLEERGFGVSGSTVVCAMEGTRPVLVEVQALVTSSSYGTPQRTTTGLDASRLRLLLAVLEKRQGYTLSDQDVFANAAGGLRLDEPAADLAVALAVASSFMDIPADTQTVLAGEIGLGGEVRRTSQLQPRLQEAAKLGFERAIVPKGNIDDLSSIRGLDVTGVRNLREAIDLML